MSKTTNELYQERNLTALALCETLSMLADALREADYPDSTVRDYRAGWYDPPDEDDADADEWAIIFALTPYGQVSWHVPRDLAEESDLSKKHLAWDGHTRAEKLSRLKTLAGAS